MPATLPFDFYQRAYKINQAFASTVIATASIKMGRIVSPLYTGIAYAHTKSLYADIDSVLNNYNLFDSNLGAGSAEYYNNNFSTSVAGAYHDGSTLVNANAGPATPKLNQAEIFTWDQTCYPCALGDTRDNTQWGDSRDGSWAEAGPNVNKITLNIYQANPSGGSPLWLNTIDTQANFTYWTAMTPFKMRVFSSPSFTSDNIPGLGIGNGYQLIAFFAWDTTGNNGNPLLFYELFAWDPVNNTIGSVVDFDITSTWGPYDEFPYTGRHDIFHTAQWQGGAGNGGYKAGVGFLIVLGSNGRALQIDLSNGRPAAGLADAAAYSDVYDIFCAGHNITRTFSTYSGLVGITSTALDSVSVGANLNLFDADYQPFPAGPVGGRNDEYFYFGDDQQGATSRITGWSIYFDTSNGNINTPFGAFARENTYSNGPYTLKRVVVVAPMQLVVGSGPNLGTQNLMRIVCGWYGGYWYRGGSAFFYTSASQNEDFIAMDHGYCEDYTGYFSPSGQYSSGYNSGIPVGAGNQHILSVNSSMISTLSNQNSGVDYDNRVWTGAGSDHFNYALYIGKHSWTSASSGNHTSTAYLYINVTGGSGAAPFLKPISTIGGPTTFSGAAQGKLRMMAFYS